MRRSPIDSTTPCAVPVSSAITISRSSYSCSRTLRIARSTYCGRIVQMPIEMVGFAANRRLSSRTEDDAETEVSLSVQRAAEAGLELRRGERFETGPLRTARPRDARRAKAPGRRGGDHVVRAVAAKGRRQRIVVRRRIPDAAREVGEARARQEHEHRQPAGRLRPTRRAIGCHPCAAGGDERAPEVRQVRVLALALRHHLDRSADDDGKSYSEQKRERGGDCTRRRRT